MDKTNVRRLHPAARPAEADRKPTVDPSQIPAAPNFLDDVAKAEWERVVDDLFLSGRINSGDYSALAAYCESWSAYRRALAAAEYVQKEAVFDQRSHRKKALGPVLKPNDKGDFTSPHTILGVVNVARREYLRLAEQFGLTPKSRSAIDANKAEDPDPVGRKYF